MKCDEMRCSTYMGEALGLHVGGGSLFDGKLGHTLATRLASSVTGCVTFLIGDSGLAELLLRLRLPIRLF